MSKRVQYIKSFLCYKKRSNKKIIEPIMKLGGVPVFYKEITWPKCSFCNQDLDFLAQITLDSPLPFSKRYSLAYIFMCPGKFDKQGRLKCPTWQPNSGANYVILQEKSLNIFPSIHDSKYPDYEIILKPIKEPNIDISKDFHLGDEILKAICESTKVGGVPSWLQNNQTPICPKCGGSMRFVAQFDAELDGVLPADPKMWNPEDFRFFHFGGDDGIGYLFICEKECSPEGVSFLWQCT